MFKEAGIPKPIQADMDVNINFHERDNIFHVSELSYECPLRMYLDRTTMKKIDDSGKWNIYRGKIFDKYLTALFDEKEIRVQHRVPGTNYMIRGRIDGLTYEDNCIYEIKTVEHMDWMKQPRNPHINQSVFYLANYDPLSTLKIFYASMGGWKCFEFNGTKSDVNGIMKEFDRKARILGDALKCKEEPTGVSCKECEWCIYRGEGMCSLKKPKKERAKKTFKKQKR